MFGKCRTIQRHQDPAELSLVFRAILSLERQKVLADEKPAKMILQRFGLAEPGAEVVEGKE